MCWIEFISYYRQLRLLRAWLRSLLSHGRDYLWVLHYIATLQHATCMLLCSMVHWNIKGQLSAVSETLYSSDLTTVQYQSRYCTEFFIETSEKKNQNQFQSKKCPYRLSYHKLSRLAWPVLCCELKLMMARYTAQIQIFSADICSLHNRAVHSFAHVLWRVVHRTVSGFLTSALSILAST